MMQTVFVDMNLKCVQLQQTGLKKKMKEARHLENTIHVWFLIFSAQSTMKFTSGQITIHQIAYTSKKLIHCSGHTLLNCEKQTPNNEAERTWKANIKRGRIPGSGQHI